MVQMKATRVLLLNAATRIFSVKGFAASTVQDIARAAGVNVSLISYHFGGKESLFRSCLESFAIQNLDIAAEVLKIPPSQEEMRIRLEVFSDRVLNLYLEHPDACRILLRDIELERELNRDIFVKTFLKAVQSLESFFISAKKGGLLAEWVEPMLLAKFFFGHLLQGTKAEDFQSNNKNSYRFKLRNHIVRMTLDGAQNRSVCDKPN